MHVRKMTLAVLSLVLSLVVFATPAAALDTRAADGPGGWTAWLHDVVDYVGELVIGVGTPVDIAADPAGRTVAPPPESETLRITGSEDKGGGLDPNG